MEPMFDLPSEKDWHRHIVCMGVEVTCWQGCSSSTFGKADRLQLQIGTYGTNAGDYANTPEGRHALQTVLWQMNHCFEAGKQYKLLRIQKELGIRS